MNSIEGTWRSCYTYTQGAHGEASTSEHRITFEPSGNGWLGKSVPQFDQSEVTLELTQDEARFSGAWQEQTAPAGHYEGQRFDGLLMLVMNDAGTELNGQWLGVSKSTGSVKAGSWVLQRVM